MANRNKSYIEDNERAGNNGNTFSNDPNKGINEAQTTAEYAKSAKEDGEVVAKDAAIIGGAVASGGASTAAAGAGGAGAGAAGAGAAGTGAAAGGASAAGGAAAEGSALAGSVGESAVTSGASEAAAGTTSVPGGPSESLSKAGEGITPESVPGKDGASPKSQAPLDQNAQDVSKNDPTGNATNTNQTDPSGQKKSPDSLSNNNPEGQKGEKLNQSSPEREEQIKKQIEDNSKSSGDASGKKLSVGEERDFYKDKNFMDEGKRSERKRLSQQKIDDEGKDDRGIVERSKDKQTAKTGINKNDALGDTVDTAGRAVGTGLDAASGGKSNARETLGGMGSELTGATERLSNTTERQVVKFAKFTFKVPVVASVAGIMIPLLLLLSFAGFGATVATTAAVSYGASSDGCVVDSQKDLGMGDVIGGSGGSGTGADASGGFSWANLSDEQKFNATQIAKQAADRDLPGQAVIIAYSTVMQESGFISVNYGDKVGPDSRGLFQQRDSWGTLAQRLDPYQSSGLFFDRLVNVANWQTIPVTQAAQKVQISAFGDAYAKHENDARNVFANVVTNANPYASTLAPYSEWIKNGGGTGNGKPGVDTGAGGTQPIVSPDSKCNETSGLTPVSSGTWINPYCDNYKMVISNYFGPRPAIGGTSHSTASYHGGMDMFSGGGGKNPRLCAMTNATVTALGTGACGNSITMKSDDNISFVYCHMREKAMVNVGDKVAAGQQVGVQGSTGNSSGEHLHLQVSTGPNGFTGTANPMCLVKTQPDLLAQMDFTSYGPKTASTTFDYRCDKRSDLGAWDQTNWN